MKHKLRARFVYEQYRLGSKTSGAAKNIGAHLSKELVFGAARTERNSAFLAIQYNFINSLPFSGFGGFGKSESSIKFIVNIFPRSHRATPEAELL